ncbi:MAG: LysM peptidoglycan-binding domain-containing protein [Anaerolineae bacterium]
MKKLYLILALVIVLQLALVPASHAAPPESGGFWHTVRFGETLTSIAWRYGVSVQAIAQANGIANRNLIFAGSVLWIPARPVYSPPGRFCRFWHVVSRGQTLHSIGRWYGVSPWSIAAANSIYNLNLIFAGQSLCIP